jgi:signal peptidase I
MEVSLPRLPRVAAGVALLAAILIVASALVGTIAGLVFAVVPLVAGIGILRGRTSSAYGYAFYSLVQFLLVIVLLSRREAPDSSVLETAAALILAAGQVLLFWSAGRSLAASGRSRGSIWTWVVVSIALPVPFLFVQPFAVPTGSMEKTLLIGDKILALRFPKPQFAFGDLAVFRYPPDHRQTHVKRIIGVPGDRIRLVNKVAYRNGAPLNEPYVIHTTDYVDSYRDNFPSQPPMIRVDARADEMLQRHVVNGEVVVPDGKYFVLGDNRDASLDSRYWGFVDAAELIAKPLFIYDSAELPSSGFRPGTTLKRGRTRWDRLFLRL